MSKAVKSVGRAIGKVVNGVGKVVTKVTGSKTLGKIAKVVAVAAGAYFTGGAILGGISGAAAGTGFAGTISGAISGAGAGLSASWAGLTSAVTGGGISALGSGWAGAAQGLSTTASGGFGSALSTAAGKLPSVFGMGGAAPGATPAVPAATPAVPAAVPAAPAAATGSSSWSPMAQMAGVQAVGGMAQSAIQAKAANDADERQDQLDAGQRSRYNTNMGSRLSVFDQLVPDGAQFVTRPQPLPPFYQQYAPGRR